MTINGGVSKNKIVCSTLSNLLNCEIERAEDVEASARGVALLAGIGSNIFTQGIKSDNPLWG